MKSYCGAILLLLFFLSGLASANAVGEKLTLCDQGKSGYVIVLPADTSPVQKSAANELNKYFRQITGADLSIVPEKKENQNSDLKQFVIGPSKTSSALLGSSIDESALPYDAIILKSIGNTIILSGHKIRGPLYSVYTLLEDHLGCRWWTSKEESIPVQKTVKISPLNHQYHPKLIYRESFYTDSYNGLFAVKEKCNGNSNGIPPEFGGHHSFQYFVHSFYPLIPPEKYFKEHPDWFAEIKGTRRVGYPGWSHVSDPKKLFIEGLPEENQIKSGGQLCLSNPEMRKELVKNALAALEKNPRASFLSISQNDWAGYCTCKECSRIAEEEGSQSGPLLQFVNSVAEEIEKVHPDILVETLAYQYTRKPPKHVRPRKNVVVRLCSIECDFASTLEKGEQNRSFREDLEGWGKIAPRLFVWDYVTNFSLYLLPFPNYAVWRDNINFYIRNNTIGLFEQGDYHLPTGDFVQMRNWVMAKLLWDPSLDLGDLMNTFLAGYYAPDLVPIYREYFDLFSKAAAESGIHLRIFRTSTRDWMTPEVLAKATDLLDQADLIAQKLEKKDPVRYRNLTEKVRRERIPLDLVWIQDWHHYKFIARISGSKFSGPKDPRALLEDFVQRLKKHNVRQYRESKADSLEDFIESLRQKYDTRQQGEETPEICKSLPPGSWIEIQEYDLSKARPNEWTFAEKDPAASNGRTVRMPSSHCEWALTWSYLPIIERMKSSLKTGEKPEKSLWHFYLSVRCEANTDLGTAMTAGIYNAIQKKGIKGRSISVKECRGEKYTMIDFGSAPLEKGSYFWIAPAKGNTDLKNVFIDRIIIVRE
ncbi:MAG: DUF4838 domain-containing protein [Planctomycetia bacterium]|nr:DUF4838 domain-containing protein [Planctomycetia bacterium]